MVKREKRASGEEGERKEPVVKREKEPVVKREKRASGEEGEKSQW